MSGAPHELALAFQSMAEAMLIGLMVGVQRESRSEEKPERHAGVRDFVIVSITGGVCGILDHAALTVMALAAIAAVVIAFHVRAPERTGITTEMAVVATFCLGFLTTKPNFPHGAPLAIGTAITIALLLEWRGTIHAFIRERMTDVEFNNTLLFLAVVFVIYPVLPEGAYGPYQFFHPRTVWLFVILVSSISYTGYFLEKFLGAGRGLVFTSVLGGLASTTAATLSFANGLASDPRRRHEYWQATVIANAIQFPRVLAVLYVVNPALAHSTLPSLVAMTAAGLAMGWVLSRFESESGAHALALGNPFRLLPALKFGALFSLIVLANKAATTELGPSALFWTSAVGGSVDVDSVTVSVSGLVSSAQIAVDAGTLAVLLALLSNGLLKTGLAAYAAGLGFGWRVASGFAVMFAAGALVLLLPH